MEMREAVEMLDANRKDDIYIGDIVAVFMPDSNKWVRGKIEAKDKNGSYYVFTVDYGFPIVAKSSQVKLLNKDLEMFSLDHRSSFGTLIDCIPSSDSKKERHWSNEALEMSRKIIGRARKIVLKGIYKRELKGQQHVFGRLEVTKASGHMRRKHPASPADQVDAIGTMADAFVREKLLMKQWLMQCP